MNPLPSSCLLEPNLDCWYQHRKRNLALWLVLLLLTLYKRIPLSSDIQNKHLVVQNSHIYQLLANKHHAVLHLLVQKIQLANSCTKKVKLWYILLLDLDLQSVKKIFGTNLRNRIKQHFCSFLALLPNFYFWSIRLNV